jgi:GTP-binding protein
MTSKDQKLAALAWNEGRGLILIANKWDLKKDRPKTYLESLAEQLPGLGEIPMLTTSALMGAGVDAILPAVKRVATAHSAELQTAKLNQVVTTAVQENNPPTLHGRKPRIYYATQVGRKPPAVVIFASTPTGIPPAYQRYLAAQISGAFRLKGTPLRLTFRARH